MQIKEIMMALKVSASRAIVPLRLPPEIRKKAENIVVIMREGKEKTTRIEYAHMNELLQGKGIRGLKRKLDIPLTMQFVPGK